MKRIVLVRTAGPRNAGSVVRAAANFGPCEVVLVRPERPSILVHPDFEQMSHGVPDRGARVRVVASLEEALADCTASVGFTARQRDHRELLDWRDARVRLTERANDPLERLALVFGNEETGLSAAETAPLEELVRIPTSDEHGSLNLAMAAGIVLATLFLDRPELASVRHQNAVPLPGADRRFLVQRLQEALGPIPWTESARRDVLASIERVFARAPLETRDARAWHLLARALGNEKSPADYGIDGTGTLRDGQPTAGDGRAGREPGAPA
ncbi:MAG TPA: RNA methyltransferase [Planctomycetota bacterium]